MRYKILAVTLQQKHLIGLVFLLVSTFSWAQKNDDFDIAASGIYYPQVPKLHKVKAAVILLKYKFPEAWLEGAYHVPFLSFQSSMGLKKNFSAQMSLGTILVSNQLTAGFRWHKRLGQKIAFNAGYDIATVFGKIKQSGFDSRVVAVIHYPNLSVGYRYKDITFTLKGEVSVVGHVKVRVGENAISDEKNFYNGFSIGLYMEQRLWKNHVIIMGLTNKYAKFNYIAWPAFNRFNRYYNFPEIAFGFVL